MNLLLDGWQVLSLDKWPIFVILASISWGMIVIVMSLRSLTHLNLEISELSSLALAGWIMPLFLISILIFALAVTFNVQPNIQVVIAVFTLGLGLAIWANRQARQNTSHSPALALITLWCIFLLSTFLHLAFVARTSLPLYVDSAQHYLIIQNLIKDFTEVNALQNFIWPVPIYYHIGFHIIATTLATVFQLSIAKTMLVLGQIIVGAIAIPLFFLVKQETQSDLAGMIAVLLGSFGWYMPSFAVNWGKYPALLSLLTIQFCWSILYLINRHRRLSKSYWIIVIAILSIGISFLIHTRSIIVIGIGLIAWTFASWWKRQGFKWRVLILAILAGGLLIEVIFIRNNFNLYSLLDPYFGKAIWITALVGLLSGFALKKYPQFAFACLASILFLLLGLFIPIPHVTDLTLLDRPLVEMILFIPLSLLGGIGYAALSNIVPARFRDIKLTGIILLIGVIIFHALMNYSFYPSNCCVIVAQDDSVALDWLDKYMPQTAVIAISSTKLHVTASIRNPQIAGADAGVWIMPLTNRRTFLLRYSTDFSREDTLNFLCKHGISAIYIGNKTQSFSRVLVEEEPDWYKSILFLPEAQIFQVTGCN